MTVTGELKRPQKLEGATQWLSPVSATIPELSKVKMESNILNYQSDYDSI